MFSPAWRAKTGPSRLNGQPTKTLLKLLRFKEQAKLPEPITQMTPKHHPRFTQLSPLPVLFLKRKVSTSMLPTFRSRHLA
jgi:hypothetical protein